jgi:hypothetical protein
MRGWQLFLIPLVLLALPCAYADVVVAGDLGSGDSFQTGTADSWATGGSTNSSIAVSFTVPIGVDYTLDQILVADDLLSGTNSLNVLGLYEGSDPSQATLLESFTIPTSSTTKDTPTLFTLDSLSHPQLTGGKTYLIEETILGCAGLSSCGTTWDWQWNDLAPPQTGYFSKVGGGLWVVKTGITPAFQVNGTLVNGNAAPEPRYTLLLAAAGALLLGLQLFSRKLRRA